MTKKITLSTLFFALAFIGFAQTDTLQIPRGLNLSGDSATRAGLLSALNRFWQAKDTPDSANPFIDKAYFLETSALLDEMRGIEANEELKDEHFYKPYLTNVAALGGGRYKVQLALTGIDRSQPVHRAAFTFEARKKDSSYLFYSPLQFNTLAWKQKSQGGFTFHYPATLSATDLSSYIKTASSFDKKLRAAGQQTDIYIAADFLQVLSLVGIDYKSDYNGYAYNALNSRQPGSLLIVSGVDTFSHFDPHDLWHERLRNVYPAAIINRPVDEGCAYLYGGSWGTPWAQVLALFKKEIAKPGADYLVLYEPAHLFGNNPQKPFIAGYVINALIVQKLEREHRFDAVMQLLTCGKYEKGNANYFATLERTTGITRANFNEQVAGLIGSL